MMPRNSASQTKPMATETRPSGSGPRRLRASEWPGGRVPTTTTTAAAISSGAKEE
jgi:hypothetical protein